jgi:hypothetical protein
MEATGNAHVFALQDFEAAAMGPVQLTKVARQRGCGRASCRILVNSSASKWIPTFFQSAHIDDCKIEKLCAHNAIGVRALSTYYRGAGRRAGLLIGFAGFDRTELSRGVEILSEIVEAGSRDHSGTS